MMPPFGEQMKSVNCNIDHSILIIQREKEILITTDKGIEIASLQIYTMVENQKPTKSFFLVFEVAEKIPLEKNIASVTIK